MTLSAAPIVHLVDALTAKPSSMLVSSNEANSAVALGLFHGAGQHVVRAAESLARLRSEYEQLLGKYELLQRGMSTLVANTESTEGTVSLLGLQ